MAAQAGQPGHQFLDRSDRATQRSDRAVAGLSSRDGLREGRRAQHHEGDAPPPSTRGPASAELPAKGRGELQGPAAVAQRHAEQGGSAATHARDLLLVESLPGLRRGRPAGRQTALFGRWEQFSLSHTHTTTKTTTTNNNTLPSLPLLLPRSVPPARRRPPTPFSLSLCVSSQMPGRRFPAPGGRIAHHPPKWTSMSSSQTKQSTTLEISKARGQSVCVRARMSMCVTLCVCMCVCVCVCVCVFVQRRQRPDKLLAPSSTATEPGGLSFSICVCVCVCVVPLLLDAVSAHRS